jgi:hypothetical protein
MSEAIHPAASHHFPFFITAPGETDVLLYVMIGVLLVSVFLIGIFYLRLHHLPDHMATKGQKIQYEMVAVLCLISLFTHNHLFWIAGLLLAFVQIPDFSTPLNRMANSLATMASRKARALGGEPIPTQSVELESTVSTPSVEPEFAAASLKIVPQPTRHH